LESVDSEVVDALLGNSPETSRGLRYSTVQRLRQHQTRDQEEQTWS